MANYNKSFNFRNGVQVDDDNFIVNANGLVGIGTSIPTQILDVHGTTKVTGLVTTTNLAVTGTSNFYSDVKVGSGITLYPSTGIVSATAFYGDGQYLLNVEQVAVEGWIINAGSISTIAKVGIGTTFPSSQLDVLGNVKISGITTFTGLVDANDGVEIDNIRIGIANDNTIDTSTGGLTLDSNSGTVTINDQLVVTGLTTFNSGVIGNLTGNVAGDINSSGVSTFSGGLQGNLTGNVVGNINSSGGSTFSGGLQGNLTGNVVGNINSSGVSTFSGGIQGDVTGNLTGNVTGTVTGNLVGIASTARSLTGTPDILVNNITATSIAVTSITNVTSIGATNINVTGIVTSQSLHIGTGGTAISLSSNARLGIGSATPTKDLQILKSGEVTLEITGSDKAQIILGQQTTTSGIGNSTALIRFGDELRGFDLLNGDQGNFNYYLHAGSPIAGIQTGDFRWFYGQNLAAPLMTLTFGGNLGIAKTNPDHKLHVVGTSTVTGNAFFGSDVNISGNLTVGTITLPSVISNTNLDNTSGISTFNKIEVINDTTLSGKVIVSSAASVGLGTTQPIVSFDARNKDALFGSIGINTSVSQGGLTVTGGGTFSSGVGIGTTSTSAYLGVYGNIEIYNAPGTQVVPINIYNGEISTDNKTTVGLGTTSARSALDFADVGKGFAGGTNAFMIVPRATDAERTLFGTGVGGIGTSAGAIIFNTTTNKFQGYTGIAWTDFH